jgi:DivIVA domain-containing protein
VGWRRWCGVGRCRGPARWTRGDHPRRFVVGVQMRCGECAAKVAVTARVCSRCGVPIVGQPTVVGAVIRHLRESYEGTNVAGAVLMCASALVGIFFIVVSVWLYVDNRDLAAHGVRIQGQVVDANADGSDEVVYTVDGTDYEVPGPEVGDRLPGDAVTVVYDPRDPSNSNLEDDSVSRWIFLGVGLFFLGWPAMPVVAGVFEADGPVRRRLVRVRPARRQPETPPKVAGQAPREPFVPGSGDKLPAELRLVLGGYAGIACGLFAAALALAAAVVFVIFDADIRSAVFEFFDADIVESLVVAVPVCGLGLLGALMALVALQARIRFSRLLRRPSDPRTATVTASKDGGRTVILDILPRDGTRRRYESLSEVGLALWLKAGMLVPGETVTVYGRSGGASELLVTSPRWGRAFLGTVTSGPTVQRGPVEPLDEKVSGATLVEWAAWAASTTFSSTGWRFGYDIREADAFRSAVRDTFLGGAVFWVSTPPVRSEDARGKQFSTHRSGYDKNEVDAFLDAAGIRLAAMESTGRPAGPLVNGAFLAVWAEWADSATFDRRSGYTATEVDSYLRDIRDTFLGVSEPLVRADNVRGKQFPSSDDNHPGYDKNEVDAFLDAAGIRLAAMEATDTPPGPLASDAVRADWAEWADSTTFSTTAHRSQGYATAEVEALWEGLRDTFLGVRQPPVMSNDLRTEQLSTHRTGYDKKEVDAFLEAAAWRLAAMESTEAMDWSPSPWAKPPLDKVSLIALITAIPGFVLVSIPLGVWGVIRTKNHQRRGRTLAVISFVLIGLWAIVGIVVGVMAAAPAPSGLVAPTTVSPAPVTPSKKKIPGHQLHGPLRKAKRVSWDQLKTGDCFNGFADTAGWKDAAVSPTRVDCRSMHEEEVTGTFTLPGGRHYPGDLAVEDASDARCAKYFERYVGIDWDSSDYFYDYLTPSPSDWRQGDHKAICLAYDPEHQETNKISLRNVKQ